MEMVPAITEPHKKKSSLIRVVHLIEKPDFEAWPPDPANRAYTGETAHSLYPGHHVDRRGKRSTKSEPPLTSIEFMWVGAILMA